VLQRNLYRSTVPWGSRQRILELAGIGRNSMGRYYAGLALRDARRRALLAELVGVPEERLWIKARR
jgi:hypothetical protein